MKVLMTPGMEQIDRHPGGVRTVIAKWLQHLPEHGIEFVPSGSRYDVEIVHAGVKPFESQRGANVAALHGLYWTAEMAMEPAYHATNAAIVANVRAARAVTVPSSWVARTLERDTHRRPFVVPHGVDVEEWQGGADGGYVLWAKNIDAHVCDPAWAMAAAERLPDVPFVSTYGRPAANFKALNTSLSPDHMRDMILNCGIYLATVPETFGIATLEAMAAGKPVVGFNAGFQPVVHGVTGYLAPAGDVDGLARGIRWARENYDVLSRNARMLAALYSWDRACERLVDALVAAEDGADERGVTVVITAYNKAATLEETVRSVTAQETNEPIQIIIVDDCSSDGTDEVLGRIVDGHIIRYIRQKVRTGVAGARNAGIAAARYDLIVTLDGDDAIGPTFVAECARALRYDNSLGIAYTGLGMMTPNGVRRSEWPGPFDPAGQFNGRNQVPTCAMFRKEMWRAVGGYRPRYTRYADLGYGSEDAAFWLHGVALGWGARQVTPAPLFLYRAGGGTSRPDYTEVPWHNFYAWDRNMPLAAPTPSDRIAWPVRVYDPPRVSVVIPVGPGHEVYAADAIDSVEAQTYYRTETIVIWDSPEPIPAWYKSGYPFVKWVMRPKRQVAMGAGAARNAGARTASAAMLIFLDADDLLGKTFIERAVAAWNDSRSIVYTDYIGVQRLPEGKSADDVVGAVGYDSLTGMVTVQARLHDFDAERAKAQPQDPPFVWAPVTCLLPRRWHESIGGFREDLPSWEDWDWHIRLARAGYNYCHLNEYLWTYRLYAGERREAARTRFVEWGLFDKVGR